MSERRPLRGQRHRSALCQNCRSRGCRIIDQGIPSSVTHHTQEARRVDAAQVLCDVENVAAMDWLPRLLLNTTRRGTPKHRSHKHTAAAIQHNAHTPRTPAAVQHNANNLRTPKHEGLYRYGRLDEGVADTTCYDTGPAELLLLFNTTRDTLRTPAAAAVKHKRAHSAAAAS
jgi:hypothetical protein